MMRGGSTPPGCLCVLGTMHLMRCDDDDDNDDDDADYYDDGYEAV